MGESPTPPTVPDPNQTAQAQYGANVQSGIANSLLSNPNVNNPYGSVRYTQGGSTNIGGFDIPRYNEKVSLSPGQQRLYDQQTVLGQQQNKIASSALNNAGNILSTPVTSSPGLLGAFNGVAAPAGSTNDVANSGKVQTELGDAGQISNSIASGGDIANGFFGGAPVGTTYDSGGQIANSFFGGQPVQQQIGPTDFTQNVKDTTAAIQARLAPQLSIEKQQLQSQLANQGVTPGSQAYETAMDEFGRQSNDANTQALLAGNQEQQVLFGQSQAKGQFANQAVAQDYAQNQGQAAFQNQAQQQSNTQNQNAAIFANQGAAQQYAQNQGQAAFQNTAQQQKFQQNAAQLAAQNAAQQQQFEQLATRGQFANQGQQQYFGQNLQNAQLYNAAQAQQFNQNQSMANFANNSTLQNAQLQMSMRDAPINEISTLLHGGQVTAPQFAAYQPGQIAAAPVAQSAYQSAGLLNQQYTTQLQAEGQQNAGLYGLGGSVAGAIGNYYGSLPRPSDRRWKRDIVLTGKIGRFNAYAFKYLWSDQVYIGVMADEVLPIVPEAIAVNDDGYMLVDYSKLAA